MADDQKNVNFNTGDVTWYIVHSVAPIHHQITKECYHQNIMAYMHFKYLGNLKRKNLSH